ncbi:MAG: AbrB/MazE/SpoVT family DNA-binding domain-containing protein [Oscillospiraceae bacterium]|nr:AbrB/MazE/SpoVT family DNA-binding domain-containing protein [Oscillospiraceae bacterium]
MKATGIVRRIDDLGRIVIPKEIRRTMRIREGDPLEIYTEKDGEVIFKKYSPMNDLSKFADNLCETLYKTTEHMTVVCDRDTVLSVYGAPKRELSGRRVSAELERIMDARQMYRRKPGNEVMPVTDTDSAYSVAVAAPILSEGDVMGCVMFISSDDTEMGEVEGKLVSTVARFLGREMEN